VLKYEKPLPPEDVIRRANVWEEIFKAKDDRKPLRVVVNRHVRDDIYEVLYKDIVKGLLKSSKKHEAGEEVEAAVVIADYTTKTLRTRLYDPKRDRNLAAGEVVECVIKKVSSGGGFIVQIGTIQGIVPKKHIGKAMRYPLRDLRKGKLVCKVLRGGGKRPILKVLDVKL